MIIDIIAAIYLIIGLAHSYYGTAFLHPCVTSLHDENSLFDKCFHIFVKGYMYLVITILWPGFDLVLSIIHIFDKSITESLQDDFRKMFEHEYGLFYEATDKRWNRG